MMATVPHVASGLGLRKFQADGFLLTRVYMFPIYVFGFKRIHHHGINYVRLNSRMIPINCNVVYSFFWVNVADDDADVPAEAMIPKYQLQDLCSEAAKLKTLGAMESVPPDRLVRLLNILEKNIRDGTRVSPIADPVSVLGWSVILYGLIITSVEVKCH